MPYDIRYRKTARGELDWLLSTYGQDFADAWDEWTQLISERSEAKDQKGSIDFIEAVEDATRIFDDAEHGSLKRLFKKRWNDSSMWDKLRAVVAALKKRTPPWQIRFSTRTLYCLGKGVPVDLEIYYEIDHPGRRVVIMMITQPDEQG